MTDEPEFYGDAVADMYDELCARTDWLAPDDAVAFLARLAGPGPALELGIGTGRVAIPLLRVGVPVTGVEGSVRMIDELRRKPGGEQITVVPGDFVDPAIEGTFPLVYIVFSTLFHVTTQQRQIDCLRNAARRLTDDGALVIEAAVPTPPPLGELGGQTVVWNVRDDSLDIGVRWYDRVTQSYVEQHVYLENGKIRLNHNRGRDFWPSELDLMAQLAGLRLAERHGGWLGQPFTPQSRSHVSVYRRAT